MSFGFATCPVCKQWMDHHSLSDLLKPVKDLFEDVRRKAQTRLAYEGLPPSESSAETAMERYAYYICFKCGKAYYGGEAHCQDGAGGEDFRPEELLCGGCSNVNHAQVRTSKIYNIQENTFTSRNYKIKENDKSKQNNVKQNYNIE